MYNIFRFYLLDNRFAWYQGLSACLAINGGHVQSVSGAPDGCCYCCSHLNMNQVPGLPGSAAWCSCSCCCYRSRSIEIGINILYNESKILWWPDFTRFGFCVDLISRDLVFVWTRFHEISFLCWPISRDFVFVLTRFHEISFLCWPDFMMLTQFHEILFLRWPDFTRPRFCVDQISRDFVFVLTRFREISFCLDPISRCWSDFTRYTLVTTEILIFVTAAAGAARPVRIQGDGHPRLVRMNERSALKTTGAAIGQNGRTVCTQDDDCPRLVRMD